MMGRKHRERGSLFYEFRLDDMIPKGHLLRRIDVFVTSVLGDLHEQLGPFYSGIGRPSIDPELLIRMLIIGYCFGIRSGRKLCGPDELDWTEKQQRKRAVTEYLAALEAEAVADGDAQNDNESGGPEGKRQRRYERQPPKVISPSDPQSAWTAKANKRVQFGYGLNYLIDIENAVIVDVEATTSRARSWSGSASPSKIRYADWRWRSGSDCRAGSVLASPRRGRPSVAGFPASMAQSGDCSHATLS